MGRGLPCVSDAGGVLREHQRCRRLPCGDIQNAYGYCPSIEVDVVGLTDAEKMRFLAYDVDKYFTPPAQFRKSLGAVTLKFSEDSMRAQKIPDNAEAWKRWEDKGAKYIGVISNLPSSRSPVRASPIRESSSSTCMTASWSIPPRITSRWEAAGSSS